MPTFRCEFDVNADLVLSADLNGLQLNNDAGIKTTFRNGPKDSQGHATGLIVTVIAPSESIDTAQKDLRHILAEQLDLLSFVTQSGFKIVSPRRLFEWEDGMKARQFKAYFLSDARYPPGPELVLDYLDTVRELDQAKPPAFTRTALKYFRYGLLDPQLEDQFMRFWLALEIIAENVKEKISIPIACPVCNTPLRCAACGTEPTRVPWAKQAIEGLIAKIAGVSAQDIIKRQFKARNGLMHGRSSESIEKECNMPLAEIVNELEGLTWNAIMSTITLRDEAPLSFGHRNGEFTNKSLLTSVQGTYGYSGEELHPPDDRLPTIGVKMKTTFN